MKYLGLRLQFFYFFSIGIFAVMFFLPIWLEDRGIGAEQIGFIMAMTFFSKLIFGPLTANLSDSGVSIKKLIPLLSFIGIIGLLAALPVTNAYIYFVAMFVATGGFFSTIPLGENLTLLVCKKGKTKLEYGQIRVVGTIAYAIFAVIAGIVLKVVSNKDVIIYIMIACCFFIAFSAMLLKDEREEKQEKYKKSNFKSLFYVKDFGLVITIQILYYVSFGMQAGFGAVYWKSIGISSDVIGYLIVPMILSECIAFIFAKKIFRGASYQSMLMISAFFCVLRWSVLAFSINPYVIALCQLTHAVTFVTTHLGMMSYIKDVVPDNLATRAQSVYDSGAAGAFLGLSVILYGYGYTYFEGKAFLIAAFFSFIAFILSLKLKGVKFKRKKGNKGYTTKHLIHTV